MFDKCFDEINKHTGAKIAKARGHELRAAFENAYLESARSMSPQDAMTAAANKVADNIMGLAKRDKLHKIRNAQAQQALLRYVADHPEFTPAEAIRRRLTDMYDLKSGEMSVEQQAKAIRSIERIRIDAMFEEIGTRFGITLNKESELLMLKAFYGEKLPDGMERLQSMADEHIEAMSKLRARLVAAGIDIGELPRYFGGQSWDSDLSAKAWRHHKDAATLKNASPDAKKKASREQFVTDMYEGADRNMYKDETGAPLTDDALKDYLARAFDNIYMDGESAERSRTGPQIVQAQQARKIHIKDATNYQKLSQRYGGSNVLDSMLGSVNDMSKGIALAENFGPAFETNVVDSLKAMQAGFKKDATENQVRRDAKQAAALKNELAFFVRGEQVKNEKFADTMRVFRAAQRNVLGGATVTALFGDIASKAFILKMNKVSGMDKLLFDMRKMSKEELRENLLMAERFQTGMVREFGEMTDKGLVAAMSTINIRASFLPAINRVRVNSGRETLAFTLAAKVKKYNFEDITGVDGKILRDYGFTAEDWKMLQQSKSDFMSVKAIRELDLPDRVKTKLAERVQSYLIGEIDVFMEPGLRLNSLMAGESAAGSATGELWRSFTQFKAFTGVMMTQIYPRLWAAGNKGQAGAAATAGAAAYMMSYVVGMTIGGMFVEQAKSLLYGKNPIDMTNPKAWAKAFLTGGGGPLLGDMMMATESRMGGGVAEFFAGPLLGGTASTALETALRPLHQSLDDKDLDVGADLFRKIRSLTPFTSLWYTRAAVDRMMMQPINESLSPGYGVRQAKRMKRDYGQTFWWDPDSAFPDELPDLSEAL